MIPLLKKLLLFIGRICTRRHAPDIEKSLNDIPPHSHSAEGWDFVADLNEPTACASSSAAGETREPGGRLSSLPPYPVIWAYFMANGYPAPEARRFYKRFQVLGWNSRVIPTLDHWPEIADYWMYQVRQSGRNNKTPPANDNNPGSDNNPAHPI